MLFFSISGVLLWIQGYQVLSWIFLMFRWFLDVIGIRVRLFFQLRWLLFGLVVIRVIFVLLLGRVLRLCSLKFSGLKLKFIGLFGCRFWKCRLFLVSWMWLMCSGNGLFGCLGLGDLFGGILNRLVRLSWFFLLNSSLVCGFFSLMLVRCSWCFYRLFSCRLVYSWWKVSWGFFLLFRCRFQRVNFRLKGLNLICLRCVGMVVYCVSCWLVMCSLMLGMSRKFSR